MATSRPKILLYGCRFDGSLLEDGEEPPSISDLEMALRTCADRVVVLPARELLENPDKSLRVICKWLAGPGWKRGRPDIWSPDEEEE